MFQDKYYEEDVYETVDDYGDEDVYETILKYKTVMKDIYEKHTEQIERFSVEITDIQAGLVRKLKMKLDEGIEDALSYAEEQIEGMKVQFTELFEDLDDIIQQKYTELEQCAKDQKTKEIELEKNRKLLRWIEACKEEIEEILNIEGKAGRK